MKSTVFTKYHIAAGAKMAEFAGYNMPIEFTGINDEHMPVRNGAGVFDVSHMGEIWVKGPKALGLLQRITTNDVAKLYDGKVQYSCMPNGRGGIVDDILVYRVDAETYMLCVNAANIDKDWAHICAEGKAFGMEAGHGKELYNASDEICQLAVQGPLAMKIVQKMCAEPVEEMEYYTFKKMPVAGCDAILSITGYTGSGGCEIYVANEDGDKLWKALWEAGEEFGLKNIGLGARDTLRLEKGFCLYGNDIDDTTSPIEAGLGWITKFADGKEFIDRAVMEKQKAELAAIEGAEVETVTDTNGLDAIKVTFDTGILFPTNGTALNASAKAALDKFAISLLQNPDTDVTVFGHTDSTGTLAVNERISLERAQAVRNYLETKGIASNRFLKVEGKAYTEPVASNDTAEGRAANRRVEVYISAGQAMIRQAQEGTLQ